MEFNDRLNVAYSRLSAELSEKKAARARIDAEIGEIALRLQKLDDARLIVAEMGGGNSMSERLDEMPAEAKNKVRDFVLSLMETMPLNQWLPANAILDALKERGYEAPASRNSAYASVYVTLGRLVTEGLVVEADGTRGKVFAKIGSTPNAAPKFGLLNPFANVDEYDDAVGKLKAVIANAGGTP